MQARISLVRSFLLIQNPSAGGLPHFWTDPRFPFTFCLISALLLTPSLIPRSCERPTCSQATQSGKSKPPKNDVDPLAAAGFHGSIGQSVDPWEYFLMFRKACLAPEHVQKQSKRFDHLNFAQAQAPKAAAKAAAFVL